MKELIVFEDYLYGKGDEANFILHDVDFWAERIAKLPYWRPFSLGKAVRLASEYCSNNEFKGKLLSRINDCPVLIYRLFKKGIFSFEAIYPMLNNMYVQLYYYRKHIDNFYVFISSINKPDDLNESFFCNENEIELYIDYGFLPLSLEYCLKYDDIDIFRDINLINHKEAIWSPFEWCRKPNSLDLLSFSGIFGSIKCFKYLLLNGFQIDENVGFSVVFNGSTDLFLLCLGRIEMPAVLSYASMFNQLDLLQFSFENGADINLIDIRVLLFLITKLHFILLQKMVI